MPQLQTIQTGTEWNVLGLQKLWGTDRVLLNYQHGEEDKIFSLPIFTLPEAYKRRISQRMPSLRKENCLLWLQSPECAQIISTRTPRDRWGGHCENFKK